MCRSAASAGQVYLLAWLRYENPRPVSAQVAGGGDGYGAALNGNCVGPHAPDIKPVYAHGHGFAGPAQGIGGDDDIKTGAGRLSTLPFQKITDYFAFDFTTA